MQPIRRRSSWEFCSRQSGPSRHDRPASHSAIRVQRSDTAGVPPLQHRRLLLLLRPQHACTALPKRPMSSNSSTWQRFEYTIAPPAIAGSAGVSRLTLTFNGTMSGSRRGTRRGFAHSPCERDAARDQWVIHWRAPADLHGRLRRQFPEPPGRHRVLGQPEPPRIEWLVVPGVAFHCGLSRS